MRISSKLCVRREVKFLLLCLTVVISGTLGVNFVLTTRRAPSTRQAVGFDFGQHMNLDWSGPKVGERLDLQHFIGRGGQRMPDAVGGEPLMLAAIDPDCVAGWTARDQMRDVRNNIIAADVPYLLISVTTSRPPEEFFKYAESLDVGAPAFLWSSTAVSPPEKLVTMVVPSHILVRRDGTIIRTWPGTSQSKKIRFQMVRQIIANTIEITSK